MNSILLKLIALLTSLTSAKTGRMVLIYYLSIYFIVRAILELSNECLVDSIESIIILLFMIDFYSDGGLK